MSDVDVRLRDGKLVGVDPDTGETVELPLGDTNHDDIVSDSLTTGEGEFESETRFTGHDPVKNFWGSSTDYILLESVSGVVDQELTTLSDTFEPIHNSTSQRTGLDIPAIRNTMPVNVDSLHISAAYEFGPTTDGETAEMRLGQVLGSESFCKLETTDSTRVPKTSTIEPLEGWEDMESEIYRPEGRISGDGELSCLGYKIKIFGKIA